MDLEASLEATDAVPGAVLRLAVPSKDESVIDLAAELATHLSSRTVELDPRAFGHVAGLQSPRVHLQIEVALGRIQGDLWPMN